LNERDCSHDAGNGRRCGTGRSSLRHGAGGEQLASQLTIGSAESRRPAAQPPIALRRIARAGFSGLREADIIP
jgi:hypothetical protein